MCRGAQPTGKRRATEAAQRFQNDSRWRWINGRQRPNRFEADEANAGEARQSTQTPKEKPWRRAKRWNECGLHEAEYEAANESAKPTAEGGSA